MNFCPMQTVISFLKKRRYLFGTQFAELRLGNIIKIGRRRRRWRRRYQQGRWNLGRRVVKHTLAGDNLFPTTMSGAKCGLIIIYSLELRLESIWVHFERPTKIVAWVRMLSLQERKSFLNHMKDDYNGGKWRRCRDFKWWWNELPSIPWPPALYCIHINDYQ